MKPEKFNKELDKIAQDSTLTEEEKCNKILKFFLINEIKVSRKLRRDLEKKYPKLYKTKKRKK